MKVKKLDKYFKGIYGSLKINKKYLFILTIGKIRYIIGDKYDYMISKENKLDFLYVYGCQWKRILNFSKPIEYQKLRWWISLTLFRFENSIPC